MIGLKYYFIDNNQLQIIVQKCPIIYSNHNFIKSTRYLVYTNKKHNLKKKVMIFIKNIKKKMVVIF